METITEVEVNGKIDEIFWTWVLLEIDPENISGFFQIFNMVFDIRFNYCDHACCLKSFQDMGCGWL